MLCNKKISDAILVTQTLEIPRGAARGNRTINTKEAKPIQTKRIGNRIKYLTKTSSDI
jgi:hypothetical protein